MTKKIIIISSIVIFLVSFLRVLPVYYQHYPPSAIYENLLLARNMVLQGTYSIENVKNVLLSSAQVLKEGIPSTLGNKLTPILYADLYKIFGINHEMPIYVAAILFSLSAVLLFLVALRLFGYWPAIIFSAVNIFSPAVWHGSMMFGFYEFAVFFFSLGLLVYFYYGSSKNYGWLVLSAACLGLAALSRNAFLISAIPLVAYDFYKLRSYQRLLAFGLPLVLIVSSFFLADALKGNLNYYLSNKMESFTTYGHLFPDPYTYHLENDKYIASALKMSDPDIAEFLSKYGYPVSFKNTLLMYFNSIIFYPRYLLWPTTFAGPIFVLLMILGAIYLRQKDNDLFKYFLWFWLPFWYVSLIVMKTNNWDHFLEIQLPIGIFITLGIYYLVEMLNRKVENKNGRTAIYAALGIFLILQMGLASAWMIREGYMTSSLPKHADLIGKIRAHKNFDKTDIVAVGIHPTMPETLNYYTDNNYIYFSPETIKRLLSEGKLMSAFQFFGVTKTIGYDEDFSREIFEKTAAIAL